MFGIDLGTVLLILLGILFGGLLFSGSFRKKFFKGLRKFIAQLGVGAKSYNRHYQKSSQETQRDIPPQLIPLLETTPIYARPGGGHYHLYRNCKMLQGRDYKRLGYRVIALRELQERGLRPCLCAYEEGG